MTFSLNEIEAMGKRAARGAGMEWGIAEEAGKTTRWLSAHGLPGPELLAELLTRNDGAAYDDLAPVLLDGRWRARTGWLCPLISGAALSDRAQDMAAGQNIALGPIVFPLLLAPYAARGATALGISIELAWEGVTLTISSDGGLSVDGESTTVVARKAEGVLCRRAGKPAAAPRAHEPGRAVEAEAWSRLNGFAQRTFAPATEASRLRGAGAGLTDND